MNFLQAAEKLAGFSKELESIKSQFPGVYSDFLKSLDETGLDDLFDSEDQDEMDEFFTSGVTKKKPKSITDHVREFLGFYGDSSGIEIVDGIVDHIETKSGNRRRVIQQTLNNMLNRGDLKKDESGEFSLTK